jgi:pseudouridine kinase
MNERLTTREKEILEILKKDPMLAQDELAERLRISRSAAAVHISNLMRKGYIAGRGYIFDDRSGITVVGKSWLEVAVSSGPPLSSGGVDGIRSGSIRLDGAGKGYLLALELARRNLDPTLFTFIGRDEVGARMLDRLQEEGVNVQNIIRDHGLATGKRLVLSGPDGDSLLVKDDEGELALGPEAVSAREDLIKSARMMLIDGDLPMKTVSYLASVAVNNNLMLSVLGWPLNLLRAQGLLAYPQFFLVCSAGDLAKQSLSAMTAEPEELFPACRQIAGEGCQALVVVFDEQGLIMATADETIFLPAAPLQAPGTVLGVTAGLAEGLSSGYRVRLAVRRAMGSVASG